jgi:hypothetical protein
VDPDSAFLVIQSGSRVLMTNNKNKKIRYIRTFFLSFLDQRSKIAIYLCPSYRRSLSALKREHPALKKMKFINFFYVCGSFLTSWIRIENPDPNTDPGTPLNPDPIRIRTHSTA